MKCRHYSACIGKKKKGHENYIIHGIVLDTLHFLKERFMAQFKSERRLGVWYLSWFPPTPSHPLGLHSVTGTLRQKVSSNEVSNGPHVPDESRSTDRAGDEFHFISPKRNVGGGKQTKKSGHAPAISGRNLKGSAKNELVKIVWTLPSRQTIQNTAADIKRKKSPKSK